MCVRACVCACVRAVCDKCVFVCERESARACLRPCAQVRASRAHCHVVIVRNFVEALAGIADAPVLESGVLYGTIGYYRGTQEYSWGTQGCSRRTHAVLTG